jgi:hypothetical protein
MRAAPARSSPTIHIERTQMQEMRTPIRMLAAAVAIAALAACADDPAAGPTGPARSTSPVVESDTTSLQPPADGDLYPGEKPFLEMAQQVPGYAGDWYDGGTRVVALTDPNSQNAALKALSTSEPAEQGMHPQAKTGGGTRFVPAQFDYLTLRDYRDRAADLVLDAAGATYLDLDEVANRVVVGILDESHREDVETRFEKAGVPAAATQVVVSGPIVDNTTLQIFHRPLEGGWQIQSGNGAICTLGFMTRNPRGGAPAFVTASHCTSTFWGLDGTMFSQNVNNLWVGREARDPAPFTCPPPHSPINKCRHSDAALVQVNSGVTVAPGQIARTEYWATGWGNPGSIDIDSTAPSLLITANQPYPSAGQWLDKMGRTTGWTSGQVVNTCAIVIKAPQRWALCQYTANYHSAAMDSGAPVFVWHGDTVTLAGVHWGNNNQQRRSFFSPTRGVQLDLGVP